MRKVLWAIFLLLFFQVSVVIAQENSTDSSTTARVNYELPYPGILPDHPLYFLKVIRDRVIKFLINDPIKKAEFNMLTSDKRLYAGAFLVDKGKYQLAVSTISKSNNYFFEVIDQLNRAREEGKNTSDLLKKMKLSALKHKETIEDLEERIDKKYLRELTEEKKRAEDFEKSVNLILKKNN